MSDGGLITPVLKNASVTDIYQLSREWADLVKRARAKKLSPDEYRLIRMHTSFFALVWLFTPVKRI